MRKRTRTMDKFHGPVTGIWADMVRGFSERKWHVIVQIFIMIIQKCIQTKTRKKEKPRREKLIRKRVLNQ